MSVETAGKRNRLRGGPVVPVLAPLWLGSEAPGVANGPATLDRALRTHLAGWGPDGIGPRLRPSIRLDGPEETPAAGGDAHFKHLAAVSSFCRTLATTVTETIQAGALALVIGGDHAISIGSIPGARAALGPDARLGVIWLDSHADVNNAETTPSGHIHGMPLGIALGRERHPAFHITGPPPWIREEDVTLIGIRLLDPGERSYLRASGVRVHPVEDVDARGMATVVRETVEAMVASGVDAVHISFDLDVLDPLAMTAVNTPVPGGVTVSACAAALRHLLDARLPVISADIAELDPTHDQEYRGVLTAAYLTGVLLGATTL
ncbi:MAG: arginase family protein [Chloroflexota bacterium]|nr:arginase family protein [Chloroflexota bacterium]